MTSVDDISREGGQGRRAVLPTPLLGLGGFGRRASEHGGSAMHGMVQAPKPPVMFDDGGGREMINNYWIVKPRSNRGHCMEIT